ncbi:P12 family lipoprotein [Borrelia turicatae]|uniref:P12 family lipoprotein n=1 Tax=Borrelia turicatae TaxID=142 RepID=UPI002ED24181
MKRSILSVCMLTLLCLLSCDVNALNELLDKAREKFLDESKDNKDLNHKQENQEQKKVVIDDLEEEVIVEIQQDMEVKSVNAGFAVSKQVHPYYVQREIEIKEEDLVPSTEYEKAAQAEIENVKSALNGSKFDQLIEEARKLNNECDRLEFSFYDILSKLNNKIRSYPQKNKAERQKLIQLRDQLNEKRSHIDRIVIQVNSGLNERTSSKYFFEQSQETLKEAITEKLRNKDKSYWWRKIGNSDFLAKKSRSDAESSLEQLESSFGKIGESMGIKKEIEEIINKAKSVLGNLAR